ncbi:unnamed protein product [Camellia sinensis]
MAAGEEKSSDFYAVLGLKKECTATELRNAYKNLALDFPGKVDLTRFFFSLGESRDGWHPDRCSASGSSKFVEESKKKFQAIQEAYSVLSDANKRFMYDVGFYDCDDDENGMGDFLNEMAVMMSQNKSNDPIEEFKVGSWNRGGSEVLEARPHRRFKVGSWNRGGSEENGETFEELQELFEEMFQSDLDAFGSTSQTLNPSSCSSSTYASCSGTSNANNKRNSFEMNSGNTKSESSSGFDAHFEGFCLGKRSIRKIPGGGKEPEEELQESEIGGVAGNRRFNLATTSPPLMTILVFLLEGTIPSSHRLMQVCTCLFQASDMLIDTSQLT